MDGLVSPVEAEKLILAAIVMLKEEAIPLEKALDRVLAQKIVMDRDTPPYDRLMRDGIVIRYNEFTTGQRDFKLAAVQAAGEVPPAKINRHACIQGMTGAALAPGLDTVIPIEDVKFKDDSAVVIVDHIQKGQFIHHRAADSKAGEVVLQAGQKLGPAQTAVAASAGAATVVVKKLPSVVIVTTGDELVAIDEEPSPYQLRRSNGVTIRALLEPFGITADLHHLPDDQVALTAALGRLMIEYDVVILSGGVSKGEFDSIPMVMSELGVKQAFHGVAQRPGKPFWFGVHSGGTVIFGLPGNPVSTHACTRRFIIPWLQASLGVSGDYQCYAALTEDVSFEAPLEHYLQVKLQSESSGRLVATPLSRHHGSDDYISLARADGFLLLPAAKNHFKAGEVYPVLALS